MTQARCRPTLTQWLAITAAFAAIADVSAVCGEETQGPGGRSRVFHIDCGLFCPGGSPAWNPESDDATISAGYGYEVAGNAYSNPSQPNWNCWFFNPAGSLTMRCPKSVEGTLYLYFLDLGSNARRQTVTVAGNPPYLVEDFPEPSGKWLACRISKDDTAEGTIAVTIVCQGGANAVISRIDFVPEGIKNALLPESADSFASVEALVEMDWRRQERVKHRIPGCHAAVSDVLSRGAALVPDLAELDAAKVAHDLDQRLAEFRRQHDGLLAREAAGEKVLSEWERLYLDARWVVRRAAFKNPLLDFDQLLFVKRFTPRAAHQCSHHVGSAQRPGSDLCILSGLKPDGDVRSIIGDQLPSGAIGRPDLSFDATAILFPHAAPRPEPTAYPGGLPDQKGGDCLDYQVYEIGVDGSGLRQLTTGPSENTEPCYLPDGRICFTSSRCDRFVQCGDWAIVFSLHTMNGDGGNVRPITEAKEGEWFPSVLDDGRIIYMRWEYVMKPFNTIQYLWTVNPDGTRAQLGYGEHYSFSAGPLSFIEARQIPGTSKVIATGAAHHNAGVGPICIVDLGRNRGDAAGLQRVTPEVGYPETSEMRNTVSPAGWYNAPWPLSEKYYLVCYSFQPAHNAAAGYGIYLMDVHGNKELVYRDRERSCYSPIPLKARSAPRKLPELVDRRQRHSAHSATVVMADVYRGIEDVPRGTVKHLRILQSVCKAEHSVPQRLDVGIGSGWDPRLILGTVAVEDDGSAFFEVPADTPIFFQALDADFKVVRGMRSFTSLQRDETVSCVGCHEPYDVAPPRRSHYLAAMNRTAQKILPPPWGATSMNFQAVVQPVLDRHCTTCHDGKTGKSKSFDLTGANWIVPQGADNHYPPAASDPFRVTASYANLLKYVDYTQLTGYGGGNLPLSAYAVGSTRSAVVRLLETGHYDVRLEPAERRALFAWIDCNAPFLGDWDQYRLAE